uniref:Uncharacterized protein n=1 Tax=Echinococcus granulosus TaxID=6210 RepID=A0A068WXY2_ECHGR|nr:hypothetical protein EgrG_002049200 [Echinococcus granulosus]
MPTSTSTSTPSAVSVTTSQPKIHACSTALTQCDLAASSASARITRHTSPITNSSLMPLYPASTCLLLSTNLLNGDVSLLEKAVVQLLHDDVETVETLREYAVPGTANAVSTRPIVGVSVFHITTLRMPVAVEEP